MRTRPRPRRYLVVWLFVFVRPLFTYSYWRQAYVLKLVGDQYLARVYRLLATRFHLNEWERNIQRKLDVIQDVYEVLSDQADSYRTQFLEFVVVLLIIIEVVVAILR